MKPEHRILIDAKLQKARGIIKKFNDNLTAEKARNKKADEKPKNDKPKQKEAK
jgi:hypothetical protein